MIADSSALATVLGFTEQDLAANRAGHLSSAQAVMLGNAHASVEALTRRDPRVVPIVVAVGFALLLMLMLTESDVDTSQLLVGTVGAMGAALFVFVSAAGRSRRRWDAVTGGGVRQVRGQVRTRERLLTPEEDGGGCLYEVAIGAMEFRVVSEQVMTAFREGQPYAGYYVGQGATAVLLSAEPV